MRATSPARVGFLIVIMLLLSKVGLSVRRGVGFAGADAHGALKVQNEVLAVPDPARLDDGNHKFHRVPLNTGTAGGVSVGPRFPAISTGLRCCEVKPSRAKPRLGNQTACQVPTQRAKMKNSNARRAGEILD